MAIALSSTSIRAKAVLSREMGMTGASSIGWFSTALSD
jgi:hypothetical protein